MVAACRPVSTPVAAGLEAVQRHVGVGDEVGEDAERVGTAADAGGDRVGQPAVAVQHLGPGLGADHPLELADHHRERMRPGDRADQVVGVVDAGDPVAHRVVHRVLEGLGARLDRDHLGAEQPHPGHVERLPFGVDLAHVDRALQPEQRRRGRGGDPVLAGAGLGDHPGLAHPPGQQRLAEDVVDLVRTGVVQVLALEQDRRAAGVGGEALRLGDRAGTAGVVGQQTGQLGLERRVVDRGAELLLELGQGRVERLGDELAAELIEMAGRRRAARRTGDSGSTVRLDTRSASRRCQKASVAAGTATTCARLGGPRQRPGRPPRCGDRDRSPAPRPTSTTSAPARAKSITSCGPRTPDSAIRTMPSGISGASRAKVVRIDLEGLQIAGVDPDDGGPGVDRTPHLVGVVHLDQRGQPDRSGPLDQRDQLAGRSSAATISSTRSAPAARASNNWYAVTMKSLRSTGIDDGTAHPDQVVERAGEAALLGQHGDRGGATGLVLARPARPDRRSRPAHPCSGWTA